MKNYLLKILDSLWKRTTDLPNTYTVDENLALVLFSWGGGFVGLTVKGVVTAAYNITTTNA